MFLLENSENIHELEKNAKMLEKINTIILNFKSQSSLDQPG